MSVSDIFEKKERFFRDLEEKTTLKILKNEKGVVSLGGVRSLTKDKREF